MGVTGYWMIDISELRLAGESGGSEGAEGVPSAAEGGDVAVLLQQLNFNLNEVGFLHTILHGIQCCITLYVFTHCISGCETLSRRQE